LATLAARRDRLPQLAEGFLVYGDRSVHLSETEAAGARPLLDRFGVLVRWDELVQALWPGGEAAREQAVTRAARLRRQIEPLGLVLPTVRGVGVVLDHGLPSEPEG
jgi:DNA-binding response OmpR family regulator